MGKGRQRRNLLDGEGVVRNNKKRVLQNVSNIAGGKCPQPRNSGERSRSDQVEMNSREVYLLPTQFDASNRG